MSVTPKDMVEAGLRYLKLDEAKQTEAREATPKALFEKIEAEAAAVQWILAACLIYHEQGVLDDVLAFIRTECGGQTSLEVAA